MSTEQYVSVAVKKEMLNKIGKLDPDKTIEAVVTEAISEYIRNRAVTPTNKTPDVGLLKIDLAPALTNQYTFSP